MQTSSPSYSDWQWLAVIDEDAALQETGCVTWIISLKRKRTMTCPWNSRWHALQTHWQSTRRQYRRWPNCPLNKFTTSVFIWHRSKSDMKDHLKLWRKQMHVYAYVICPIQYVIHISKSRQHRWLTFEMQAELVSDIMTTFRPRLVWFCDHRKSWLAWCRTNFR